MSATVQTIRPGARFALAPFLIAILVALSIGATAGSITTRALDHRSPPVTTVTGWDAEKLVAMQGAPACGSDPCATRWVGSPEAQGVGRPAASRGHQPQRTKAIRA